MEQFKFSLQKLLDIRTDKEEKSKQSFVEAQRQKQLVQNKLNELKANYDKHKVFNKNESIVEQKIKNNYLYALNIGINQANKDLEKKNKIVEEKREELKQNQIERKTVEIIKEKKQVAFITEQNRIEQVNNDEFALYSFMRNMRGGELSK
jgi:flagellar FliJ protein